MGISTEKWAAILDAIEWLQRIGREWSAEQIRAAITPPWVETKACIRPTREAADAFWKYWHENGETHKHGYYESTWGAINAALNSTGQLDASATVSPPVDHSLTVTPEGSVHRSTRSVMFAPLGISPSPPASGLSEEEREALLTGSALCMQRALVIAACAPISEAKQWTDAATLLRALSTRLGKGT
jgi:hypothetical protein